MNINRKIQLTAVTVIANGALALGLASSPALAATCNPQEFCIGDCAQQHGAACMAHTPPGCTYTSSTCTTLKCGVGNDLIVICDYQ